MWQDRLEEVKGSFDEKDLEDIEMANSDIEMPAGLHEFYEQISRIKEQIGFMKKNLDTLTISYRNTLLQSNEQNQQFLNRELEASVELQIKTIVRLLKQMAEDNKRAEGHIKLRTNMHLHNTKQFMELVSSFRNMKAEHKDKIKLAMIQRILIVKPSITSDELDNLVDGSNLKLFLGDEDLQKLDPNSLVYIEQRYEDILKIEVSISDLHQVFMEMVILVESQGNFNHADTCHKEVENIEKANQQVANAVKYRKRRRRLLFAICMLMLLLLGVGVIVVLSIGGVKKFWRY